ncbi:MAG TPA: ABC transporter permease [Bacillota bacterium]|nr:ABC transporter permease [Clostridiales bacterium]HPT85906.1 ABC transporter permease [Bacillota bacterium]
MGALYKKEFKAYFNSMIGWVVIAFLLFVAGIFVNAVNLNGKYPGFEVSLGSMGIVLMFVVPILTMRSLAEERATKTDQLLFSLPMSVTQMVLAKYFAMLTVFAIPIGVMALYPLFLLLYGSVNLITAYSALFGYFLLGASLIAIGLFVSSLTESIVISAVVTFGAILLCNLMSGLANMVPRTSIASFIAFTVVIFVIGYLIYSMTKNYWLAFFCGCVAEAVLLGIYIFNRSVLAGSFSNVMKWLSLFDRMNTFIYSRMFDITSVIYYISVAALFVFFTTQSVDRRRWN